MSTVVKLNMIFDSENMPDFGDITFDRNGNLILTNNSVIKLITNVTRDRCGEVFNVAIGTKAIVADTGATFLYHANDRWYLCDAKKFDQTSGDAPASADQSFWLHPVKYPAGYVQVRLTKNSVNYILSTEILTFTVTVGQNQILTKTLTKNDYMGDGYYAAVITLNDAKILHTIRECNINISITNNEEDITQQITISEEKIFEWYNEITKGGTIIGE